VTQESVRDLKRNAGGQQRCIEMQLHLMVGDSNKSSIEARQLFANKTICRDIRTTNILDQEGVARAEASICVHRVGTEMVQVLYSSSGASSSLLREPKDTEANDTAGLWRKEARGGCASIYSRPIDSWRQKAS
jgi:hypothetical protein